MEETGPLGPKVFAYGLLLFVVMNVGLLLGSMAVGAFMGIDDPAFNSLPGTVAGIIVAFTLGIMSLLLSRRLGATEPRRAMLCGFSWSGILLALTLFITVPNGTTGIIFGAWVTYLLFIGVAVGPLFNLATK